MLRHDDTRQRAGRHYVHAALIVAVLMTSGIVAGTDSEAVSPVAATRTAPPAPSGQTVRNGVLPHAAGTFRSEGTAGWELMSRGHLGWVPDGHDTHGAL